jgi:hypothetical protein
MTRSWIYMFLVSRGDKVLLSTPLPYFPSLVRREISRLRISHLRRGYNLNQDAFYALISVLRYLNVGLNKY